VNYRVHIFQTDLHTQPANRLRSVGAFQVTADTEAAARAAANVRLLTFGRVVRALSPMAGGDLGAVVDPPPLLPAPSSSAAARAPGGR